jgi:hypothetical protein
MRISSTMMGINRELLEFSMMSLNNFIKPYRLHFPKLDSLTIMELKVEGSKAFSSFCVAVSVGSCDPGGTGDFPVPL